VETASRCGVGGDAADRRYAASVDSHHSDHRHDDDTSQFYRRSSVHLGGSRCWLEDDTRWADHWHRTPPILPCPAAAGGRQSAAEVVCVDYTTYTGVRSSGDVLELWKRAN